MTTRKRFAGAGLAAILLTATPLLGGCWQGKAATTTVQATQPTGNGVSVAVGPVRVQNATVVKDVAGPNASLLVSLFNTGTQDDALVAVEVNGLPATVTPAGALLPKDGVSGVSYGYPGDNTIAFTTDAAVSTYVPVLMQFRNAGVVEFEALVVPRAGYYADVK